MGKGDNKSQREGKWTVLAAATGLTALIASSCNHNSSKPGPEWLTYAEIFGGAAVTYALFRVGTYTMNQRTMAERAYLPTDSSQDISRGA